MMNRLSGSCPTRKCKKLGFVFPDGHLRVCLLATVSLADTDWCNTSTMCEQDHMASSDGSTPVNFSGHVLFSFHCCQDGPEPSNSSDQKRSHTEAGRRQLTAALPGTISFPSIKNRPGKIQTRVTYLLSRVFAPLLHNTQISGFATLRSDRVYGPPISICELFHVDLPSFDNKLQCRFIGRHSE
jgi:hypothetical protein